VKDEKVKEVNSLLFEFIPLYHQKFAVGFHQDDNIRPRCNKSQIKAMFIIKKKEKILPTDLGKCMDMRKGSLTTLIDSLEGMNLVRRKRDPHDRRKTWLSLTKEGMEYLDLKIQAYERNFMRLFEPIPEEEVDELVKSLKYVVDLIKRL
jgi:DNA-binding MarR family transcriptional regulator